MAEPIGLASGVITLVTVTSQCAVELYKTIKSFKTHPQTVRDLLGELEALKGVLKRLDETIKLVPNEDFHVLIEPLKRCSEACQEFGDELMKCYKRSGSDRTSFRDWTKLVYMKDGIDGFRRLLANYKSTIIIALTDASLRISSVTTKTLEEHKTMIEAATVDLDDHLQEINQKLGTILEHTVAKSSPDAIELRRLEAERKSTLKGLEICRQLSDHIRQISLNNAKKEQEEDNVDTENPAQSETSSHSIVNAGLQECRYQLSQTSTQLEDILRGIMDRLTLKSESFLSQDEQEEFKRLRDESQAIRQALGICSKAETRLQENVSVIENYATGDETVQFLVSTNEKTINGKNTGFGWRQRQIAGHFDNETVRQLSQDAFKENISPQNIGKENSRSPPLGSKNDAEFDDRYGRGRTLPEPRNVIHQL
ncbi:hypothetical protein BGZ63DRAFT_405288 [Mariannaea sp. PMI_226]|nr:hypothetical protein BGZ63DRAFT_405288 [Mariannaea sp. PMI_226]